MKKALIAVAALVGIGYAVYAYQPTPKQEATYLITVNEGDTVWSIASRVATDKEDVREIVYNIIHDNHIKNANIQPGQELKVRVVLTD